MLPPLAACVRYLLVRLNVRCCYGQHKSTEHGGYTGRPSALHTTYADCFALCGHVSSSQLRHTTARPQALIHEALQRELAEYKAPMARLLVQSTTAQSQDYIWIGSKQQPVWGRQEARETSGIGKESNCHCYESNVRCSAQRLSCTSNVNASQDSSDGSDEW